MSIGVKAREISFNDVLAQTDTSFKNLFNMGLLPKLEAGGIVPKGLEKDLQKRSKAQKIPRLLAHMKRMKPERFIDFLSILEKNSEDEENEDARKNVQKLMVVMSPLVKAMKTYGGEMAIQSFLDTAEDYRMPKTETATEQEHIAIVETPIPASRPPLQPPPGYMNDREAKCFGRDGGTLYSPIHGIEVIIPPDSAPQGIAIFSLAVFVYLQGPFELPNGIIPCSPTVWFTLDPCFDFVKDVTVRIPHSARVDENLEVSVYSTPYSNDGRKGPPYVLSEKVASCKCDWYNTEVHVRHFSPHRNGINQKDDESTKAVPKTQSHSLKHSSKNLTSTTLKHISKQKSSSFEKDELTVKRQSSIGLSSSLCHEPKHSSSTPEATAPCEQVQAQFKPANSAIKYCISREMPRDRTKTPWDAKFHVFHCQASSIWNQIVNVEKEKGNQLSPTKTFHFIHQSLQFTCQGVSDGWSVEPTDGEEITLDDLEFQSTMLAGANIEDAIEAGAYPVNVTYHIDSNHSVPHNVLKCTVHIAGANRELKYMLTSSNTHTHKVSADYFTTLTDLYDTGSRLVQELTSGHSRNIHLDPTFADHLALITDISLQISDPETLSKMLHTDQVQFQRMENEHKGCAELVFQLLYTWACERVHRERPTIAELCTALKVADIMLTPHDDVVITDECREPTPLMKQCVTLNDSLLNKLCPSLQVSWRFVGRFIGLSEHTLKAIAHDYERNGSCEQAFQMLKTWHSTKGKEAKYGRLFTAIERLCSFESTRGYCNAAYSCLQKWPTICASSF